MTRDPVERERERGEERDVRQRHQRRGAEFYRVIAHGSAT